MVPRALMPLLVDTDAFGKLGVSGLLAPTAELLGVDLASCARLAALPHMLRRGSLRRQYGDTAADQLLAIADAMAVVPDASTAWLDRLTGVPQIDPGEVQIFACSGVG